MATAKRTPKVSRITRDRTLAYARKQTTPPSGRGEPAKSPDDAVPAAGEPVARSEAASASGAAAPAGEAGAEPMAAHPSDPAPADEAVAAAPPDPGAADEAVAADPPAPGAADEAVAAAPARARSATITMPVLASVGAPPAMPPAIAPAMPPAIAPAMPPAIAPAMPPAVPSDAAPIEARVNLASAEDPTRMPGPREIPAGGPDDPAPPPGRVPPGDSRSMRRSTELYEFALIYRIQTYVISRFGVIGTRGQWRVVEYPTSASASHAYARECSRFVSEGFSDYRA